MARLWRRIPLRRKKDARCPISRLPNELIILIAWSLSPEDISTLIQTCRGFAQLLEPILYPQLAQHYRRNARNETVLCWAAKTDQVSVINKIRTAAIRKEHLEASFVFLAMLEAAKLGHTATMISLLELGGDLYDLNPSKNQSRALLESCALHDAAGAGHVDAVQALLDHGVDVNIAHGVSVLASAAQNGKSETVQFLVTRGADIKARNLIAFAVKSRDPDLVRFLLNKGAEIDGSLYYLGEGEEAPALVWAQKLRTHSTVRLLLERGADPNVASLQGREAALHVATKDSDVKSVELLLKYGAEVNIQDRHGHSPLHNAARTWYTRKLFARQREKIIQLLLERGADVLATDSHGDTPLIISRRWGRQRIINILAKATEEAIRKRESDMADSSL
ncbi:ankyrin repeat-containing domain protein [Aspergillus lucknowensis]|uniref:Ankyrin repeat-containing domain protein n=1 Tax=Aspergillus lucknowensis TaxID=176173 RepID=A0ABR4LK34_9EURO